MSLPHTLFRPIFLLLALSLGAMTNAAAQTRDVAGARDYPGIGRFGGSVITGYQVKDFDAARMQGGGLQGRQADRRAAAGRPHHPHRLSHQSRPLDPGSVAQFRDPTGEGRIRDAARLRRRRLRRHSLFGSIDALPIPQMWVDGFNYRYFAGRKVDGGRETYASVIVSENNREIYAQLVVAELGAIENKMVDAAAMAKGLGEAGHIALYGIYFDTDKAVVKPESRPTLEQIAKLLAGQPQLNVFIVGHTDNQGAYDYNLDLSRRRAEAVAAELVKNLTASRRRGCVPRASASSRRSAPTPTMPAAR